MVNDTVIATIELCDEKIAEFYALAQEANEPVEYFSYMKKVDSWLDTRNNLTNGKTQNS